MILDLKHPGEENVDIANALIFTSSGRLILGYKETIGKWIPLGGKKNPGENNQECLIREIYEESGGDIMYLEKIYIGTYEGKTPSTERLIKLAVYTIISDDTLGLIPKNEITKIEDRGIEEWLKEETISTITREILNEIMQVNMQLEEK